MTGEEAFVAKVRTQGFEEGREQGLKEGREQGLKQGREEGREQGREQGRIDIVVGILVTRFGPVPETLLAAIPRHPTGMTQLAQYAATVATLAEFEQVV